MADTFIADRDTAFTNAVLYDDWKGVRKFCRKYNMDVPKDRKIMKAGVYKAAQCCTNIPEEVKTIAFRKCFIMGFNPLIEPPRGDEDE